MATTTLDLDSELSHLIAARDADLIDATVFYAGRLLEALSAEALIHHGLTPSNNAYGNLGLLTSQNILSHTQAEWAHALRRLGNAARHLIHPLHAEDADWSVHFLDRWLVWYGQTCNPLADSTGTHALLDSHINTDIRGWLEALDTHAHVEELALEIIQAIGQGRIHSSTPSTVLLDRLINRKAFDLADRLADVSCRRWPTDRRLGQLQALVWSRQSRGMSDPEERQALLHQAWESIQSKAQDEEGLGIAGGIAKQLWSEDTSTAFWLDKARSRYESGWKQSGNKNTYLGINAAATALWSEREVKARKIAAQVEAILSQRAGQLLQQDENGELPYWDVATIAEAQLIQGHRAQARQTYANVWADRNVEEGMQNVSRQQADQLDHAIAGSANSLWELEPPSAPATTLAITGHRTFAAERLPSISTRLEDLCRQLTQTYDSPFTILSGLALGADQLFPETLARVANQPLTLEALLPFDRLDYEQDFTEDETTALRSWLSRCATIRVINDQLIHPDHQQQWRSLDRRQRVSGYAGLALCLANRCDVLVAIWDGEPARGAGGTAEVIDLARELGKPVWWLNPTTDDPATLMRP